MRLKSYLLIIMLTALVLGTLVIVFLRFQANPVIEKVLVIGLDGADFDRMQPMLDRGELPVMAELIRNGARGKSLSLIPSISPASWVAFTSGKNPGKTGVLHFLHPRPDNRYQVYDITSRQCRVKRIWDILSEKGKKVVVQGVPVTYPPEPVNGTMISGWLAPKNSVFTYPPELAEAYRNRGYVTFVEQVKVWGPNTPPDQYDKTVEEHLKVDRIREEVALELMRESKWDFFMVVFENIDHIQHVISTDMKPVEDYYRRMDTVVGHLCDTAGPNTLVAIGSDHGFGRVHKNFNVRHWLQQQGLLHYKQAEEYFFKGTIRSSHQFSSAQAVDFEESHDLLNQKNQQIEFEGTANFGEDGLDFTLPLHATFEMNTQIRNQAGERIQFPIKAGETGFPVDPEAVRIQNELPVAPENIIIYSGTGSDQAVEADMGWVNLKADVLEIRSSGTRACIFDYIKLDDEKGNEIFIDSDNPQHVLKQDTAATGEIDGKWWLQKWERFQGGSALVANPNEDVNPIQINLPLKPGHYHVKLGTFAGSPESGNSRLIICLPPEDGLFSSTPSYYGKPEYTPGENPGFFLWQDEFGWHLRWSGEAKAATKVIDWKNTYAWDPFWSVSPFGSLFLNAKDREPDGVIESKEYETARQALADQLLKIKDPDTGKPIVVNTFFREELYTGPYTNEMPDLLFEVADDYCIYHRNVGSHHKRDGILILNGPGIKPGMEFQSSLLDITPTLLFAMDLPVAEDMDGRVIIEAFAPEFRKQHQIATISTYETETGQTQPVETGMEISPETRERLKALGYMN